MKLINEEKLEAEFNLKERKLIEQAKGILMDRFGLPESQAMRALQKKSTDSNRKMIEVSKDIIEANEHF
jgi:response regulator NasT